MEGSEVTSDPSRNPLSGPNQRRYGIRLLQSNLLSTILEHSGILQSRSALEETEGLIDGSRFRTNAGAARLDDSATVSGGGDEVSIRIIGIGEPGVVSSEQSPTGIGSERDAAGGDDEGGGGGGRASTSSSVSDGNPGAEGRSRVGSDERDSMYQRYDLRRALRWFDQILPFSLLLLVVFIRQHLQGFFVTIWVAAVMFKSNDVVKKQTALKGERRVFVLVGISILLMLHVFGIYWWYRNDDLLYPLIMFPPKSIPPFWHTVFIIMVNDTMVRQTAMILKCFLLINYKNTRGRNYRKQGQMLTVVEYFLLLYRALLPTPVWYRFFLNKEYGSLFSSLTTGLYLTFKLTSVVEKVQSFFAALKGFSHKEVHYGSHATTEQVIAAGDLCAICQEKMHAPILLTCKHIFCEDCVSEWFERERTCPLCRALVKPAGLRSFGDGSTSLYFQMF